MATVCAFIPFLWQNFAERLLCASHSSSAGGAAVHTTHKHPCLHGAHILAEALAIVQLGPKLLPHTITFIFSTNQLGRYYQTHFSDKKLNFATNQITNKWQKPGFQHWSNSNVYTYEKTFCISSPCCWIILVGEGESLKSWGTENL